MGFGDYVHWTAIIRDLYNYINDNPATIRQINSLHENKRSSLNRISKIVCENNKLPFKFFVEIIGKGNLLNHYVGLQVFQYNPYVTKNKKYPNLIYLEIESAGYLTFKSKDVLDKLYDDMHVVSRYALDFGLHGNYKYSTGGDFHFSYQEIRKVKNHLPKKEFIFVEPQNHKYYRESINFSKFQKLVTDLKERYGDRYEYVQISPSNFQGVESKFLKNCITFNDIFTYRETILFAKHAKLCIVPHGGLSNGLAADTNQIPNVISIYPCLHKPIMTTFCKEIVHEISDGEHYGCWMPPGSHCEICNRLNETYDFGKIFNDAIKILD